MTDMSAVILGAGVGSRLRPLTDDRPKCVVELAGEPLAVRMLRQLHARGVRRATVVVGHMADRARALRVKTGRGCHSDFKGKLPDNLKKLEQIDLKTKGYVMFAGSRHKRSVFIIGEQYDFFTNGKISRR